MPNIGDIKRASEVGYAGRALFVWIACSGCGITRWRPLHSPYSVCQTCGARRRAREQYPITYTGMREPDVGDTATASVIGVEGRGIHIYAECPGCGTTRWVRRRERDKLCICCAVLGKHQRELSGRWKGGIKKANGYVYVRISSDDPLFVMVSKHNRRSGFIAEHRLVMARHLHRPLLPSEVVHHINGVKNDNRFSNLRLMNEHTHHPLLVIGVLQASMCELEQRCTVLEAENVMLCSAIQKVRDSIPDKDLSLRCYNTLGDCLDSSRRYSPTESPEGDECESA